MISDNGASRSQSEVHERNLDDKIAAADQRIVTFTVNGQLLRIMQAAGWDVNPETDEFMFDTSVTLTLKDYFDIVSRLLEKGYPIPTKWISKTFNIPITGEPTPPAQTPFPPQAQAKPGGFLANFQ